MAKTKPGHFRRTLIFLAATITAASAYGAWRYHDDKATKTADAATSAALVNIPVTVASVTKAGFPLYLYGLGTVDPLNSVVISSRVTGVVTQVAIQQGQMVKKGDLLAEIDPRPYQAVLDQATAKQSQDDATLRNAQLNLTRLSTLLKKTFETQQNVDAQQAVVDSTIAEINADKATVDAAKLDLDFTRITSPLTGKAGFRTIDPGNIVQANQPQGLFTVIQLQPISVTFTQPQENVAIINKTFAAGPVTVDALGSDGKTVLSSGKLAAIDNRVDQASGTISLKAVFDNSDNALWPGLSVSTRTHIGTLPEVLTVPDSAVEHGPAGAFAYVIGDDGKAHRQPIKTGSSDGGNTVVSEGLHPGQRVAVTGQFRLFDGASVTVTSAAPTTPAGGSDVQADVEESG
jgi:multidrug efflux system membrane fusion protein